MNDSISIKTIGALAIAGALAAGCGDDDSQDDDISGTGAGSTTSSSTGGGATSTGTGGAGANGGEGGAGATGGTGGAGVGGGGGSTGWAAPACSSIAGTAAVTFTLDEGATLTPGDGTLSGIGYTFGLAALDTPNTLVAEHKGEVLLSDDAGCSWTSLGTVQGGPFTITAGAGGVAYAWADNGPALYRIANRTITSLTSPATNIVGLGVDPADGMHLRVGDASGNLADSTDGGDNWTKHGTGAAIGDLVLGYRFAFDPNDLEHVLYGQATHGASVSTNGGDTWVQSSGLGQSGANAFSLAVSPADGQIVWAEAIEIGPDVRHVYRSVDGGATFEPVVTEAAGIDLINGNLLAPHATNVDVLYFVFGSNFQNYGTDVFRYDHASGKVTKQHNPHHDVSAIVASPADPSILYFGLTVEQL